MITYPMHPLPQDEHFKVAAFGGTMSGVMASIQWQNILSTLVLSILGTLVSFMMSKILERYSVPDS